MMLSWLNGVTPAVPVTFTFPGPPHVIVRHWIGWNPAHENAAGATMQVLSIERSHGTVQTIWPESFTDAALPALPVAVLFMVVHARTVVAAVTTAVKPDPCVSVPTVQFSVCVPTAPVT